MLVIVTSTIKPVKNIAKLSLTDIGERERQYEESIHNLLHSKYVSKIVVCDNSNHSVDKEKYCQVASVKSKEIEFLEFEGDTASIQLQGKGYGEGEILDYALKNSQLIREEKWFIKLTGRLMVDNLDCILKRVNQRTNYFQTMYLNTKKKVMDTRFFACTISDYNQYFRHLYKEVNDSEKSYLEKLYAQTIMNSDFEYRNMPIYPKIVGQSGSSGVVYKLSFARYCMKDIMCRMNLLKV